MKMNKSLWLVDAFALLSSMETIAMHSFGKTMFSYWSYCKIKQNISMFLLLPLRLILCLAIEGLRSSALLSLLLFLTF
jgi:hypothetical protein